MLEIEGSTPIALPPDEIAPRGGVLADVPPQLLVLAFALGAWWSLVSSTIVLFVLEAAPVPPLAVNAAGACLIFYFLGHTVRCLQSVFDQATRREGPRRVWAGFAFRADLRAAFVGFAALCAGPIQLAYAAVWYWFETGSNSPIDVFVQVQLLSAAAGLWLLLILARTFDPRAMLRWLAAFERRILLIFAAAIIVEGLVGWILIASIEVFSGLIPVGVIFRFLVSTTIFLPIVLLLHVLGTSRREESHPE